ncbi:MAG: hypothetical protein J6L24_01570, partial [Oscillospiraceae bacterium]|nr:hypothetical protein [Oscillospiraceae bacterium]
VSKKLFGRFKRNVLSVHIPRQRRDITGIRLVGEGILSVDTFAIAAYTIIERQFVGSVGLIRPGGTSFGLPFYYIQLPVIRILQKFLRIIEFFTSPSFRVFFPPFRYASSKSFLAVSSAMSFPYTFPGSGAISPESVWLEREYFFKAFV